MVRREKLAAIAAMGAHRLIEYIINHADHSVFLQVAHGK
jgi:hypothetical protein